MRRFRFVDFAAHFQKGFRNHIVSVSEVPDLVRSFGGYGCYATYFFYADEILTYISAQAVESKPSIAGYPGKVWAPYLPLDLDHPDFEKAREAAWSFSNLFLNQWKINPHGLQIYFSGSKGFHVMLDSRLFGRITPSKMLPSIFAAIRRHLTQALPEALRETVDLGIKDRVRLLRLANTVHEKSGLYKVIVTPDELGTLNSEHLRELAKAPRPLSVTDETGLVSTQEVEENPEAVKLFRKIRRQIRQFTHKPFEYHFKRPQDLSRLGFPCAGAQKIWESHVEPGYRNNCAIRLASELRLLGLTEPEAIEKLAEWNEKNEIELPDHELQSVIRSAYHHGFPYRYSCRDEILRHFCPLARFEDCQSYVAERIKQA